MQRHHPLSVVVLTLIAVMALATISAFGNQIPSGSAAAVQSRKGAAVSALQNPTSTPTPTKTRRPTKTPRPSVTPRPTNTPYATATSGGLGIGCLYVKHLRPLSTEVPGPTVVPGKDMPVDVPTRGPPKYIVEYRIGTRSLGPSTNWGIWTSSGITESPVTDCNGGTPSAPAYLYKYTTPSEPATAMVQWRVTVSGLSGTDCNSTSRVSCQPNGVTTQSYSISTSTTTCPSFIPTVIIPYCSGSG
jgi:hypothetical protein